MQSKLDGAPVPIVELQPKRSIWLKVLRLAIVIVVVLALAITIDRSIKSWNSLPPENRLRLAMLDGRWLLVSATLYGVGLLPSTLVLSRALSALGVHPPLRYVAAAQLIGHPGKYVPGKAMVVVIRAAILNRSGTNVSLRAATIAIMIETLTMISTGAMIALLTLLFLEAPTWMKQISGLMAVAAGASTCPPLLRLVVSQRLVSGILPFVWTAKEMLRAWFWNAVTWLLFGGSLMTLVLAIPESVRVQGAPTGLGLYSLCLAAISLAFVAGFLSLLPGGALVRELVLTTMLTPVAGPSAAIAVAILLRMVHLAVESALAILSWTWLSQVGSATTDMDGQTGRD
jgi:glycosyltransferase 2 family protein